MSEDTLAVLIISCDRYSDVWPYFFYHFWKSWPTCPYPIYLGSTTKSFDDNRIQTLLAREDKSWSDSTLKYLEQIVTDYVLLIQEDFFLERVIDSTDVDICLAAMKDLGAKYCRLAPDRERLKNITGDRWNSFGWIDSSNVFRISTQASIWHRQSLIQLLQSGESPWEFEILGSERTRSSKIDYLSTKWRVLTYDGHGALVRGKWTSAGIRLAMEAGLMGSARPRMSFFGNEVFSLKRIIYWFVLRTSPGLVRRWNLRQTRIRDSLTQ